LFSTKHIILAIGLLCFGISSLFAQKNITFKGVVLSDNNTAVIGAKVITVKPYHVLKTDSLGNFSVELPLNDSVEFKILATDYKPFHETIKVVNSLKTFKVISLNIVTQVVTIEGKQQNEEISTTRIDPKLAKFVPSAFNDFSKTLTTMAGVVSNSELSSSYSVRGGSYDENMVYVNNMEIYKPMLTSSGQQEGLSFVNQDLVSSVEFSAGGWKAKYGDKLSSVLNITYKKPKKTEASFSGGLLGGTIHFGTASKNKRVSFVIGARNKNGRYLFKTLPVQGQYFPNYYDVQSYLSFDISRNYADNPGKTTIGILTSFANNNYEVIPQFQQTSFGTAQQTLQLNVAFDGMELLKSQTYQGAFNLSHKWNTKAKSEFILSALKSMEREYVNLESGYKLCELVPNLSGLASNNCATTRGLGTNFNYARNGLDVNVIALENRNAYIWNSSNKTEFGARVSSEKLEDVVSEYGFTDSADYVNIDYTTNKNNSLNSIRTSAFVQHEIQISDSTKLTAGVRLGYWNVNKQLMVSPRIQFSHKPTWKKDVEFQLAWGVYRQPPFYREMRDFQTSVNLGLRAQSSMHYIAAMVYNFKTQSKRNFKLTTDIYYKHLWDIVPYDIDNVKLRYYGQNSADGYAYGASCRISGEFIRGEESWFSLSLLRTRENVDGDNRDFIRRPTDQLVTFSVFFQDHMPNHPSLKMYLNGVYGSGLPSGVPNSPNMRQVFDMPSYKRVDLGLSKFIVFSDKSLMSRYLQSVWLAVEILNVIGANNTISYTWIKDTGGQRYAVPNTLSQRFFNIRLIVKY
jgi:hypothetical protein